MGIISLHKVPTLKIEHTRLMHQWRLNKHQTSETSETSEAMYQFTTWEQYIDYLGRGLCIDKDTIGELVAAVAKVHKLSLRDGTLYMQDHISIHTKACLVSNNLATTTLVRHCNKPVLLSYMCGQLKACHAVVDMVGRTVDFNAVHQYITTQFARIIDDFGEAALGSLLMHAVWFGKDEDQNTWHHCFNQIVQHLKSALNGSDHFNQYPLATTYFVVTTAPSIKPQLTGSTIVTSTIFNKTNDIVTQKTKFYPVVYELWLSTPTHQLLENKSLKWRPGVSQTGALCSSNARNWCSCQGTGSDVFAPQLCNRPHMVSNDLLMNINITHRSGRDRRKLSIEIGSTSLMHMLVNSRGGSFNSRGGSFNSRGGSFNSRGGSVFDGDFTNPSDKSTCIKYADWMALKRRYRYHC